MSISYDDNHYTTGIMVVSVLTHCALLYFVHGSKAIQMNLQNSLIWELILCQFKLGYYTTEATKNICCVTDEGSLDHSTDGSKYFAQVARISTIRQGQIGLKQWIPSVCYET